MKRMFGLVGLLALFAGVHAQEEDTTVATLVTPKEAVFATSPELAVAPYVERFAWSPDGRYLLAVRRDAMNLDLKAITEGRASDPADDPAATLVLYDVVRHESTTLMSFPSNGKSGFSLGFTKTPGVAYVLATRSPSGAADGRELVQRLRYLLVRVSAADQKATMVADLRVQDLGVSPELLVAPVSRFAVVHGRPFTPSEQGEPLIAFDSAGKRVGSRLGGAPMVTLWQFTWSADGARLYANSASVKPHSVKELVAFALPGLEESKMAGRPAVYKKAALPDLVLQTAVLPVALARAKRERWSLWLCSKEPTAEPSALIATSCSEGELAPDGGAVAFLAQGALFVRPLRRMDMATYLAAQEAAKITEALSVVKQAALAALMFSADHDDQFPDEGSWRAGLTTYMVDSSILEQFHYTYKGPKRYMEIEHPTETELGYVDCPGGRAVVYADGHARYVPNP